MVIFRQFRDSLTQVLPFRKDLEVTLSLSGLSMFSSDFHLEGYSFLSLRLCMTCLSSCSSWSCFSFQREIYVLLFQKLAATKVLCQWKNFATFWYEVALSSSKRLVIFDKECSKAETTWAWKMHENREKVWFLFHSTFEEMKCLSFYLRWSWAVLKVFVLDLAPPWAPVGVGEPHLSLRYCKLKAKIDIILCKMHSTRHYKVV